MSSVIPPCRGCRHLTYADGNAICEAVTVEYVDFLNGTRKQIPVSIIVARQPVARCGVDALLREAEIGVGTEVRN